jgi:two-component system, chemotaxis family, CheB/CheR fusion protein
MPARKNTPSKSKGKKDSSPKARANEDKPRQQAESKPPRDSFPIVGIGASAGGVQALETFFAHMPADCRMAFVIVQHLDPHHKSMMDSLLAKETPLQINDAADKVRVRPGQVYLKPPGKDVTIRNQTLYLQEAKEKEGTRLPIDTFFRSLAADQKEKAICVILSGASHDGTLGAKLVKGEGGLVVVQDENQAEYNRMPQSVIDAGLADLILPVEQMPQELLRFTRHPFLDKETPETPEEKFEKDIQRILMTVRTHTGHDFSLYKRNTVRRRIERRMALNQINELSDYRRYLRRNAEEVIHLFKDLTINVTSFFRDGFAFKLLKEEALHGMLDTKPGDGSVRIWVPGCASGEEAYSIAMLVVEVSESLEKYFDVKIFATDINQDAIEAARSGSFPDSIAADVSPERLKRFFAKKGSNYYVDSKIRDMIVFAVHDITRDPPFSSMDLISCRNLLIYMGNSLQAKVLPVLHYALKPGGILFLGTSETTSEASDLFVTLEKKAKIFKSREIEFGQVLYFPMAALHPYEDPENKSRTVKKAIQQEQQQRVKVRELVEKTILEKYAHPAVLLDSQANIIYFHGDTSRYLSVPSGEPEFNIFRMVSGELHFRLTQALESVKRQKETLQLENIQARHDDGFLTLNLFLTPLSSEGRKKDWLLVEFEEQPVDEPAAVKDAAEAENGIPEILNLQRKLHSTRQELQATIEELETSNEELKSANEELQANNEELQSTNEEMESAKEELQSTNEELETVNSELLNKNQQLTKADDDLKNLFAATDIGTVFLDNDLRIKRFTSTATDVFNLKAVDIGRSISDITSNLEYDNIFEDAEEVLDKLSRKELEIRSKNGESYVMRIVPYRSGENVIEGVVMSFLDVSAFENVKTLGRTLRKFFEIIMAELREPVVIMDERFIIFAVNQSFYRVFKTTPQKTLERQLFELDNRQWNIPELRQFLEDIIPLDKHFEDYEVEAEFPRLGRRKMSLNGRRVEAGGEYPPMILLRFRDIT